MYATSDESHLYLSFSPDVPVPEGCPAWQNTPDFTNAGYDPGGMVLHKEEQIRIPVHGVEFRVAARHVEGLMSRLNDPRCTKLPFYPLVLVVDEQTKNFIRDALTKDWQSILPKAREGAETFKMAIQAMGSKVLVPGSEQKEKQ